MSEMQLGKYEFHLNATKDASNVTTEDILEFAPLDESAIRLKAIGFTRVGRWILAGQNDIDFFVYKREHKNSRNVLYAFVVDGHLKYVGKTIRILAARMRNYRKPGTRQLTSKKNHEFIRNCLQNNHVVEIYFLPDNGLLNYGGFHLNLAAGLEDDLIRKLNPPWNGGKKETENETLQPTVPMNGGDSE